MEVSSSNSDLKATSTYRSVYALAKQLDERKKQITSIVNLFDRDIENVRLDLVEQCTTLVLLENECIGRKSREMLWRKGFYDFIAIVKKHWRKEIQSLDTEQKDKIRDLLLEGITIYKNIALEIEHTYDLHLNYLIDFSILTTAKHNELAVTNGVTTMERSIEAINYALETVHSSLLSLGDLHRYFIEFNFDRPCIKKADAANYYFEAFKVNPTIGMAQNQLGTLFSGQNFDLDSIYHYLYSLICTVPFELSENNVCKLLLAHVDYLEQLPADKVEFSLRDFFARFFLIIDIFFFDKNVPEFTNECHCVLVDLKKVLCSKSVSIKEGSLFKIVCILLFCMSKLKMINSQKVYSLNAFLVAVCSNLVDACVVNMEQFILTRSKQNLQFQDSYSTLFAGFETIVRKSREDYKMYTEKYPQAKNAQANGVDHSKSDSTDRSQKSDRNNGVYHRQFVREKPSAESNRSSDEAKESDLKTPLSSKLKKRSNVKMRRRRKKALELDDDDSSDYDSESDFDSDLSTTGDHLESDMSSNFDSDFSDEENDDNKIQGKSSADQDDKLFIFSDDDDLVVEEETIIYPDEDATPLSVNNHEQNNHQFVESFAHLNMNGNALDFKSDIEDDSNEFPMIKKAVADHLSQQGTTSQRSSSDNQNPMITTTTPNEPIQLDGQQPPVKLKYKSKYSKIDPNVIIDFGLNETTMRSLKVLFDWLRANQDILFGCFHSNPEFIHKIMKLLNYCNIDIFTRKVYFERSLIKTPDVRDDLCHLFDIRATIPLSEDFVLKKFDLFKNTQTGLNWEVTIKEGITQSEENIMRIFKMVDFGFFICKMKKFNYKFCAKTRRFTENVKKKREKKSTNRRERRSRNNRRKSDGRPRGRNGDRRGRKTYTSNEEKDTVDETAKCQIPAPRKGYLRNRNQQNAEKAHTSSGADDELPLKGTKCEIMGQLWLRSEVKNLESKMKNKPMNVILTPYVVVDAKALTNYMSIVRNLVKTKKFVVLIPNAVLSELDELKKNSDQARNVIRWLEQEFVKGNRHMRSQRVHENLTISLLKVPKKIDRDATHFLQIAQFCNYIVTHHNEGSDTEIDVLTFLSGDNLNEKKLITNFSYTGILDAIPVRYDQISDFYAKFKKK